jgi:hypothetical protein
MRKRALPESLVFGKKPRTTQAVDTARLVSPSQRGILRDAPRGVPDKVGAGGVGAKRIPQQRPGRKLRE